jgi:hypothetical protein
MIIHRLSITQCTLANGSVPILLFAGVHEVIEGLHMIILLQGSSLGVLSHGDSPDDPMLDIPQGLSFLNHLNTLISLSFHLLSHRE